MDVESPYNVLIGKPWLQGITGMASTFHQCIKFPMPVGIGIIRGDTSEDEARDCNKIDVDQCERRTWKQKNAKEREKEEKRKERLISSTISKGEDNDRSNTTPTLPPNPITKFWKDTKEGTHIEGSSISGENYFTKWEVESWDRRSIISKANKTYLKKG